MRLATALRTSSYFVVRVARYKAIEIVDVFDRPCRTSPEPAREVVSHDDLEERLEGRQETVRKKKLRSGSLCGVDGQVPSPSTGHDSAPVSEVWDRWGMTMMMREGERWRERGGERRPSTTSPSIQSSPVSCTAHCTARLLPQQNGGIVPSCTSALSGLKSSRDQTASARTPPRLLLLHSIP